MNKVKDIRYWAGALVFVGLGLILYLQFLSPSRAAGDGSQKIVYDLKHGSGAYSVARDLSESGIIRSADYFKLYMGEISEEEVESVYTSSSEDDLHPSRLPLM